MKTYKKQKGTVLLWSLVILLGLLMLGVTSIKMSGLDTRIAGNEIYRMLTYQAAESSIIRTSKLYYLNLASKSAGNMTEKVGMTDQLSLGNNAINVDSRAKIALVDASMDCPILTGLANSMDASQAGGGMDCQLYTIDVSSNLSGSGARSQHSTGVVKFVPVVSGR